MQNWASFSIAVPRQHFFGIQHLNDLPRRGAGDKMRQIHIGFLFFSLQSEFSYKWIPIRRWSKLFLHWPFRDTRRWFLSECEFSHPPAVSCGAVALLISMSTRGQAGGTEMILQLLMRPPVMFGNSSKNVITECAGREGVPLISSF